MTAAANSHRLTALLLQMTLITLSKECKQTLQQTRSAAIPLFDRGSKTTAQLLCYYGASLREKDRGGIERERERERERTSRKDQEKEAITGDVKVSYSWLNQDLLHVKEKRNETQHLIKEHATARDTEEPARRPDDQKGSMRMHVDELD